MTTISHHCIYIAVIISSIKSREVLLASVMLLQAFGRVPVILFTPILRVSSCNTATQLHCVQIRLLEEDAQSCCGSGYQCRGACGLQISLANIQKCCATLLQDSD